MACEPVLPFMLAVFPAALARSIYMLAVAVVMKSLIFAFFERGLPWRRAAWRMFLGNILTSVVGVLVAGMIANFAIWLVGIPLVCLLCWLPCRRLVREAPLSWLSRFSPLGLAVLMTMALIASCILFALNQEVVFTPRLRLYWSIKVVAIFLALLASVTLTTIWEEWAIWRLSSQPPGTGYFTSVLRTNLYVLILVLIVPAAMILPQRLKSPNFLTKNSSPSGVQTNPSAQERGKLRLGVGSSL